MKPAEVKSSTYTDSIKENNDKDSKFVVDDIVRISKYKSNFAKGYVPNWSEEVFTLTKVKNVFQRTKIIADIKIEFDFLAFCVKRIAKNKLKGV